MSDAPLGRFCWHELLTTAPDDAADFYPTFTGWGTAPFEGSGEPYTLWMNGQTPVGGFMKLPQEAIDGGAPTHWIAYVSTPDIDGTTDRARDLGATVHAEVVIPTVGAMAVMSDPQGAIFAAYQPADETPGHDGIPELGEFSWHELATDDWKAAWDFYSALFGWVETEQMDMGEMGIYHMFGNGGPTLGGMFDRSEDMPVSAWLHYVRVPNAEAAAGQVEEAGGKVVIGPMEVPNGDHVAICADPTGAAFAVHSVAD